MHANTSLVGTLANIVHKDGQIYEGIFNTFSSDVSIKNIYFLFKKKKINLSFFLLHKFSLKSF